MSLPTSAPQCESESKPKLSKCIAILHLGKVYAPLETLFVSQEKAPDPPKEKLFRCEECDQRFVQKKSLQRHLLLHTGVKPHTCEVCGKAFTLRNHLGLHMRTHRDTVKRKDASDCDVHSKFHCPKCPYGTNHKGHLRDHMMMHTGEKSHRCEVCGKTFRLKGNLKSHLRVHTVCETCGKEFTQRSNLQAHEKKRCSHCQPHADKTLVEDEIASDDSSSAFEGNDESDTKPAVGKHQCSLCPYTTHRKYFLARHLRSHSAGRELPHRCEQCGKGFALERTLRAHRFVHTGNLPYVCVTCGKRFTCALYLRRHQKTHSHRTEETSDEDAPERHTKPDKKFRCKKCSYSTDHKGNLHNHLLTHYPTERPHRCELCGKGFQRRGELKRHTVVHTRERPFACDTCGKAFGQKVQLTVHQRTHTGERPFACSDCGKRFASSNYLKNHRRHVHAAKKKVKDHACLHCHFKAADSDSLRAHLRRVHSRDHFCSLCGRGFPLLWELQRHEEALHSVKKEAGTVAVEEEKEDDEAPVSSLSFNCKQEPLEAD